MIIVLLNLNFPNFLMVHRSEHMGFFIANEAFSLIPIIYLHNDLKASLKGFTPALLLVVMNGHLGGIMEQRVDEDRQWSMFWAISSLMMQPVEGRENAVVKGSHYSQHGVETDVKVLLRLRWSLNSCFWKKNMPQVDTVAFGFGYLHT